jgi:hypothetical protein|tara:strand:- start:1130 stop:1351 length:222 start_codon:yes stop_codon:yes gene_type:complete
MKAIDIIAVTVAALIFMLVTGIAKANPVDKITNWLSNEKTKIVEYQTKSWADSKEQLANTKQSILNLFKKDKE